MFYTGVWGAISSRNWDINDATVVCRQLGYSAGAEVALKNGVYGLVSGPVWITNLQCTGSESNVMECVHDGLGNKTEWQHRAYTVASVICKDSSFNNGNKSFPCIVTHRSAYVSLSNRYTALYNHKFLNNFINSKGVN